LSHHIGTRVEASAYRMKRLFDDTSFPHRPKKRNAMLR
jgi:hypothetical protein